MEDCLLRCKIVIRSLKTLDVWGARKANEVVNVGTAFLTDNTQHRNSSLNPRKERPSRISLAEIYGFHK